MFRQTSLRALGLALALTAPLSAQQAAPQTPQQAEKARGGPFVELRAPHFVPAAQAGFMKDDDRVVGVDENGVAKAYLVYVMAFHHIIEDQFASMRILATW